MQLAQETPLLLHDEPPTFLDIAHPTEHMDLLSDLHTAGRTVAAVLHDLNQAARYASHLVAMLSGEIIATGDPTEILTTELVAEVFGLRSQVVPDPVTGPPMVVPLRR